MSQQDVLIESAELRDLGAKGDEGPGMDDVTRMIPSGKPKPEPQDDGRTVVLPRSPAALAQQDQLRTALSGVPSGAPTAPVGQGQARSADTSLLGTGARVAEFEITGVIGQGGFGVVYRAWDHALEREVAIKEYLPASLSSRQNDGSVVPLSERHQDTFDAGMRSFINEARLLAQFDHPSLLKVYRFWQERGTTYMVMPLYKGETLGSSLKAMGSQVDEAWLLTVMDGVTQALAVMHQSNCYHRDIAPDNIILLEGSGLPVVLDFGAARRVIADMAQAITVILKPGYAPIEQYAEVPDMTQGAWTDVYALGAVMHVAVCGRPPPPSVARLLNDRYIPLSSNEVLSQRYSQRLLKSIDSALGVRPETRPQSMAALRDNLGLSQVIPGAVGVATPQPAAAQVSGKRAPMVAPTSGRALKLGVIAVAATVVLAAGGWWMQRSSGTAGPTAAATLATANPGATPAAGTAAPAIVDVPFDPSRVLQELAASSAGGFQVVATPSKPTVRIAKDRLEFGVRSNHAGFVYVYMLSSGGEMFQMFPNQLDKRNQIKAGETLSLPRPSWPMEAGGPAGTDQFVVLVSEQERDQSGTGIQNDGVFGQFPLKVLAALEATRAGRGPSTLLGKSICPANAACSENYGATGFKIVEE